MCGIAGILNLRHEESPLAVSIHAMADRMSHRGPDDEGYVLIGKNGRGDAFFGDDTANISKRDELPLSLPERHIKSAYGNPAMLAFGHRRLSIIDLTKHGHQPMCTPDRRYWLVYNGEIYNYRGIAKELQREGVRLHGGSDTEVLLNAFVFWGPRSLDLFNGMFAFAVWDNVDRRLFCARDRIGIKPFYYSMCGDFFVFASDIKTIAASGLYRAEPDPEGLYLAMAYGIAPRPTTAFRGIQALRQAHFMSIDGDGSIETRRYWSVPIGTQDRTMTEDDAVDLLEEQLHASIKRRLIADVPVGTFMSGGIDSTTISVMASRFHPGIKAFTLAYEETAPELDEVPQARATASMCDMQHIVHHVRASAVLDDLNLCVEGYEEPYYGLAANHVISKVVADHGVKVVLNGLGGDELFAGYSWYRNLDYWKRARRIAPILRFLAPALRKRWALLAESSNIRSADRLHSFLFRHNSDAELRQLFSGDWIGPCDTIEYVHDLYVDAMEFDDEVEALSYMDLMNYIGNHHVHRIDQFTMMHSIEGRFPFLDHELVEAAFRIPSHLKRRGKVQKYVLRQVAKKYIARECLAMTKKGFSMPVRQWLEGPLREIAETKLSALSSRDTINGDTAKRWRNEFLRTNVGATKVWHLVALELWYERFMDNATRPATL